MCYTFEIFFQLETFDCQDATILRPVIAVIITSALEIITSNLNFLQSHATCGRGQIQSWTVGGLTPEMDFKGGLIVCFV